MCTDKSIRGSVGVGLVVIHMSCSPNYQPHNPIPIIPIPTTGSGSA